MKYLVSLMLCVCLLSYSLPAYALSGNDWRKFPSDAKGTFIMGVMQGWINVGEVLGEQQCIMYDAFFNSVVSCVLKKNAAWTHDQVIAVVEKHIEDHPGEWNDSFTAIMWRAITDVCEKKKIPTSKGK